MLKIILIWTVRKKGFLFLGLIMIQKDSGRMAKAYVADLCGFVAAANKENARILNKTILL